MILFSMEFNTENIEELQLFKYIEKINCSSCYIYRQINWAVINFKGTEKKINTNIYITIGRQCVNEISVHKAIHKFIFFIRKYSNLKWTNIDNIRASAVWFRLNILFANSLYFIISVSTGGPTQTEYRNLFGFLLKCEQRRHHHPKLIVFYCKSNEFYFFYFYARRLHVSHWFYIRLT